MLIGSSDNEPLLWAREFGLEFGIGLAGKILLSSTKLEQSRSQPQNKSGPSTGGFPLGGFGSVSRLKVHIVSSSARCLACRHSVVAAGTKVDLLVLGGQTQTHASAGSLARDRRPNVSTTGHTITRDSRGSKAAFATILVEAVGFATLCTFLLADLLTGVLLLLGSFFFLKLAAGLADVLLAGNSVHLAA